MTGLAPAAILWLLFAVGLAAALRWDDDDNDGTVDEHGIRRVSGEEPREVGLP